MLRRPGQHGAGDAEVVVFSRRTGVDGSAFAILDLQIGQLLIGAANCRRVGNSDQIRLKLGVEQFEQIASADGVNRQMAMSSRPRFDIHAVAMATDLHSNHARTERLQQDLGVG